MAGENFDEAFKSSLMTRIASDELPALIRHELDDQSQILAKEPVRRVVYGFGRVTLTFLLDLCRLKQLNKLDLSPAPRPSTGHQALGWRLLAAIRGTNVKRWSRLVLCIFVVVFVWLLINLYFQYVYDINKIKLHSLDDYLQEVSAAAAALNLAGPPIDHLGNVTELRMDFWRRAQQARATLKTLGAPFLEFSFMLQISVLVFVVGPALSCYLMIPIESELSGGWLLLAPKALLGARDEIRLATELLLMELNRFSTDGLTFAVTKLEQLNRDLAQTIEDSPQSQRPRLEALRRQALTKFALRLRARHQSTLVQLRTIALEGRLNPLNRTRACRDRMALYFMLGSICVFSYMQFVVLFGFGRVVHQSADPLSSSVLASLDLVGWRDALAALSLFLTMEVITVTAFGLMAVLALLVHDQLVAAQRLRVFVLRTIAENEVNFRRLWETAKSDKRQNQNCSGSSLSERIELDLLTVVMLSRVFARSCALAMVPLNSIASMLIQFAILCPLLFRIHSAYVSDDLKAVSFLVGIGSVCVAFGFLATLGHLHWSCLRTFRCYWSLVAQLSYFEQNASINQSLLMQTSVAVFTLRRELSDARQSLDKFACRVLSIPITNTNVTRMSFWVLFVFVSFSQNVNIFGESLARVLRDPFGLFKFLHKQQQ